MSDPPQPQWCAYKFMIPDPSTPEPFLVSRDVNATGAKEFCRFDSPADALEYLQANMGGPNNEVLEHHGDSCKMYFDLDRPDTRYASETVAMHMLSALSDYLHNVFGFDFAPIPGTNCQLAQATTDKKTSVHLCCDVRVPSVIAHRMLTKSLIKFVMDSTDRWPALVISDPLSRACGSTESCVIDSAVYTQFRSFRMLGMVKFGRDNALIPMLGSSHALADHLIGLYPSLCGDMPELPQPVNSQGPLLQMCGTHARRDAPSQAEPLPPSAFSEFEDLVNGWKSVQEAFAGTTGPLRFSAVSETPYNYRLRIDKRQGVACVYAKRHHVSNNIYIILAKDRRSAELVCHDAECEDIIERGGRVMLHDDEWGSNGTFDSSGVQIGGLHAQGDNIEWDQDYDEPQMRDLPDGPLVCVLAGMGIGKTVAIKATLRKSCRPETKVLVVTHSRSLAAKIYEDFKELGFVNYQHSSGQINDCKVVVCLDSLCRVVTRKFDTIVIDEAVAVFLHFNSTQMLKRAENAAILELNIMQARSTYFVDATLDATFIKNIVDYFCGVKSVTALWVRNRHVRPSNRNATITLCEGPLGGIIGEGSLVYSTAVKVLDLLTDGKRVVCCSSTKKFTETLEEFIAERKPDTLIKVYNANTAGSTDLRNVDAEWIKYDLLIYSPSISSGVSFVAEHFDCLVAYLVNSQFTPGVETGLQQLFRVRRLKDGGMYLFVHDTRPGVKLPCSMEEIETLLSQDISLVAKHFVSNQLTFFSQIRISGERIEYDKDRLSWHIIGGIIQTQNLSAMHYTEVLAGALRTDYGIPVTLVGNSRTGGQRDLDLAILQNAAKTRAIPAFDTVARLDAIEYDALKKSNEELTLEQRAAMRLYDCEHGVWGVEADLVDETFYRTLVMGAGSFDYYFHVKRFMSLSQPLEENRDRMRARLNEIIHLSDKNLELFKSRSKQHYSLLLAGQALLQRIMGMKEMDDMIHFRQVLVPIERLETMLGRYLSGFNGEELKAFKDLFNVKPGAGALKTVQRVMTSAFDVRVGRQYRQKERSGFHVARFDNEKLQKILVKYHPSFPAMG
jgi:hypothetical protein